MRSTRNFRACKSGSVGHDGGRPRPIFRGDCLLLERGGGIRLRQRPKRREIGDEGRHDLEKKHFGIAVADQGPDRLEHFPGPIRAVDRNQDPLERLLRRPHPGTGQEHRDRSIPDHDLRDAAHQQVGEAPARVGRHRQEVRAQAQGGLGDLLPLPRRARRRSTRFSNRSATLSDRGRRVFQVETDAGNGMV
jgi:hypothetical protein